MIASEMDEEWIGPCLLLGRNERGFYSLTFSAFDKVDHVPKLHDRQGGGYTWHAIVDSLVRMRAPEIASFIDYDPEGNTFVALSTDENALRTVAGLIAEAVGDPALLRKAIANADPSILE